MKLGQPQIVPSSTQDTTTVFALYYWLSCPPDSDTTFLTPMDRFETVPTYDMRPRSDLALAPDFLAWSYTDLPTHFPAVLEETLRTMSISDMKKLIPTFTFQFGSEPTEIQNFNIKIIWLPLRSTLPIWNALCRVLFLKIVIHRNEFQFISTRSYFFFICRFLWSQLFFPVMLHFLMSFPYLLICFLYSFRIREIQYICVILVNLFCYSFYLDIIPPCVTALQIELLRFGF